MPELPEIYNLSRQMDQALVGIRITDVELRQKKCLNVPIKKFHSLLKGKTIGRVTSKGKWIFADIEPDAIFLLNLGMGGDVILHKPGEALP